MPDASAKRPAGGRLLARRRPLGHHETLVLQLVTDRGGTWPPENARSAACLVRKPASPAQAEHRPVQNPRNEATETLYEPLTRHMSRRCRWGDALRASITDEYSKADALANIAKALAATDPDRAELIAQSIPRKFWKARALVTIAEAGGVRNPV
jgi:hypothetical protein